MMHASAHSLAAAGQQERQLTGCWMKQVAQRTRPHCKRRLLAPRRRRRPQVQETCHAVKFLHNEQFFAAAQKRYTDISDKRGLEVHCLEVSALRGRAAGCCGGQQQQPVVAAPPARCSVLVASRLRSSPLAPAAPQDTTEATALEFLPHHFLLCSAGATGVLRYQDTSTGRIVATHRTKLGPCGALAQNPWNGVLCLGHGNGSVTMWTPNIPTPVVRMLCHHGPVRALAADTQGRHLVTTGADGQARTLGL